MVKSIAISAKASKRKLAGVSGGIFAMLSDPSLDNFDAVLRVNV
jgi:hypothetical protein